MTPMRAALIGVFLLVLATMLGACTARGSERCRKVCEREAHCVDEKGATNVSFDEGECESACTSLERDDEGRREVERHAACLSTANNCDAVIECMLSSAPVEPSKIADGK
jgi:hypothetical protein